MTRVRPATAADVDAVAALEAAVFGADAWSRAAVAEELTGPGRHGLVAVDGDATVWGYLVVLVAGDVADLQRVAVAPRLRRQGVASALLAACEVGACARMLLEVRADNAAALAFYARHRFAEIARRRRYYADGTDAVVMQREVAAAADR